MKRMDVNIHQVRGKRVFVGLSGGVDSAVSAALLQRDGARVTGVFIKGWYPPGMPCTWADDRRDAMRVAARLRLPFVTLDASVAYKRGVIDYLLREYSAGRTPNPDIMCNREVKFGAFYDYARTCGADMIATGHYAQLHEGTLIRGADDTKDQSYFLWAVPRTVLSQTLFPVGHLPKSAVRSLAASFKLPNAGKKDSQGICFLGSISVEEFLMQEFDCQPGPAVDAQGVVVGEHAGALLYTIGARVPLSGNHAGPWYVRGKDIASNTLTVSHERTEPASTSSTVSLTDTNWLTEFDGASVYAQYRYHGPHIPGSYDMTTHTFTAHTQLPETLAPGQSLVLYVGTQCVGGGIIR